MYARVVATTFARLASLAERCANAWSRRFRSTAFSPAPSSPRFSSSPYANQPLGRDRDPYSARNTSPGLMTCPRLGFFTITVCIPMKGIRCTAVPFSSLRISLSRTHLFISICLAYRCLRSFAAFPHTSLSVLPRRDPLSQ